MSFLKKVQSKYATAEKPQYRRLLKADLERQAKKLGLYSLDSRGWFGWAINHPTIKNYSYSFSVAGYKIEICIDYEETEPLISANKIVKSTTVSDAEALMVSSFEEFKKTNSIMDYKNISGFKVAEEV